MSFASDLNSALKNDDEALLIMSGLGFFAKDLSFIERLGGAKKLLASDYFGSEVMGKLDENLLARLAKIRSSLDRFYDQGGFLISALFGPRALFKHDKAPLVFFGRYQKSLLDKKRAIAIVGARSATPLGLSAAKKLARALAEQGIVVVSGGAMGIDQAAHQGALEAGGETVLVSGLACDLAKEDRFSQQSSEQSRSLIIYPFGPLSPQQKFMFVERNRYVATLSDALVVVEGRAGSGTLYTAGFAKAQNLPVFAIPGAIDHPLSHVPNQLLEQGQARALVDFARFGSSFYDAAIKIRARGPEHKLREKAPAPTAALSSYVVKLLMAHQNALGFDEMLLLSGKAFAELQRELLSLELAGQIKKQGSQFVLLAS